MSGAHQEENIPEINNLEIIKTRLRELKDIRGRDYEYKKLELDKNFPEYIINNKKNIKIGLFKMDKILSKDYENLNYIAKENLEIYKNKPFPHIVFENFFSKEFLEDVLKEFPDLSKFKDSEKYNSKNEVKFSNNKYTTFQKNTKKFIDFLNSSEFLVFLENLTSTKEKLIPDPHLMGGGLHEIKRGGVLKIHTDFNRHPFLPLDRRLNLLVYLNKNWSNEYGGELELWDNDMKKQKKNITKF